MMKVQTKGPGRPKGTGRARGSIPYLTEEELSRFFAVIRKERNPDRRLRNETAFRSILFFGLRVGEAAGLMKSDVRLDPGEIRVAGLKRGDVRTYMIPEDLLPLLRRWTKTYKGASLFGVSRELLQHLFRKYSRAAGLPGHSIHDLRHSCAILQAQAGASQVMIQKWLRQRRASSAECYVQAVAFKDQDSKMATLFKGLF